MNESSTKIFKNNPFIYEGLALDSARESTNDISEETAIQPQSFDELFGFDSAENGN